MTTVVKLARPEDGWDTRITDNFIQMHSGKAMYFLDPKPEDVNIEDIAHTLSLLCRFGGHCNEFYSVAEHSVRCAMAAPSKLKFEALMHDATEAYLVDMPRPIKQVMSQYKDIERRLDLVIREKFGLLPEMPPEVHYIDNAMLATEKRDLMNPSKIPWADLPEPYEDKIVPWDHEKSKDMFMYYFNSFAYDVGT